MQTAANFGTIPMRNGNTQATAKLLPFDGDAYGVFAFIETVVLINEAQGNERLNYTQRSMPNPMSQSAAMDLVAAEDGAVSRYAIDSASQLPEPEQRRTASVKLTYHRNVRESILKINGSPEKSILVATRQPGRCRASLSLVLSMPRRGSSQVTTATARWQSAVRRSARPLQAAIAIVIVRKGCESTADARVSAPPARRPAPPLRSSC